MLALVAAAQLASGLVGAAGARPAGPDSTQDSTYTSPALRALVARASARNAVVPRGLESYRVGIESELSILLRRPDGTEGATQVEEVESVAHWRRPGEFTQRVVGYRSRLSGFNISVLEIIKQAWAVPLLYGNRLGLFLGRDSSRAARRAVARDTAVIVVHPFAPDRDSVYRFRGGDTALTIRVNGRAIPVVLIHVAPRPRLARRTILFRGDVYLDASRAEIVRMRGAFEVDGGHQSIGGRLLDASVQGVAFVDLTNREVDGRYWLPATQRIEGEAGSPFTGETRTVFRMVSAFGEYLLNDTAGGPAAPATPAAPSPPRAASAADTMSRDTALAGDTLRVLPHRLTFAPADSISGFSGWHTPIGDATTAVRVDDFTNVAPDRWRPFGPPRLDLTAQSVGDFVHFDRVEGLYTGFGATLRFRDAAPGLTARAHAGWAWWEGTARGGANLDWTRGSWVFGVGAARSLDNTNDFRSVFTSGPFLESLILQDDYDYVDRRTATVSARGAWSGAGEVPDVVVRFDAGPGEDAGDRARLTRGILPPRILLSDSLLRPNRNVLAGSYFRSAVTLDLHPGIDAGFVREGIGAHLHYEVAGGSIAWERAEVRLVADRTWGPFTAVARADAGIVAGTVIPPQQLFEIGSVEGLLAYDYKQFGGDRAAVWQGEMRYALPLWNSPLRLGSFVLPSPSPALAVGFQSGWADAGTVAASRALVALGSRVDPRTNIVLRDSTGTPIPASRPSDGVRTSINVIVRFFGGAAGAGVAQSLDRGSRLQFVVRIGAAL